MKPTRFKRIQQKESLPVDFTQTSTLIPVSLLHTHAYWEYPLYLEKALDIEAPPTPEMFSGTHQHNFLDTEHEKKAEITLTIPEAVQKAQIEVVLIVII